VNQSLASQGVRRIPSISVKRATNKSCFGSVARPGFSPEHHSLLSGIADLTGGVLEALKLEVLR